MRNTVAGNDGRLSKLRLSRRLLLTTALAVLSTLSMTFASPAQAQEPAQDETQDQAQVACPANRICLYEHVNFGGRVAIYAVGSADIESLRAALQRHDVIDHQQHGISMVRVRARELRRTGSGYHAEAAPGHAPRLERPHQLTP